MRQYVGMAVAGTLLLAAGLGLYWVLNMGRANTLATGDDAPQLTADATPVKEVPPTPAPRRRPRPRVRRCLSRWAAPRPSRRAEQLVSTDETAGDAGHARCHQRRRGRRYRRRPRQSQGPHRHGPPRWHDRFGRRRRRRRRGRCRSTVRTCPTVPDASTTTESPRRHAPSVAMTDPVAENTALTAARHR